jgi:succinyl-diaminopimelate desuccinylase
VARAGVAAIKAALACVDEGELTELTRELVRIPSVVRPGDPTATEAAVARHVEAWLTKQGFDLEVQEVAPGRPNVLAWLGEAEGGPSLLLEGHTDVVTEGIRPSGRIRPSPPSWSTGASTGGAPPT